MFTGIIEEKGIIKGISISGSSGEVSIGASKVLEGTVIGDSIAVNGVCLTVTAMGDGWFRADVMAETFRRSALGSLGVGDKVNLERALSVGGRLGGHIVSGHIDGTGTVKELLGEENAVWVTIETGKEILRYIVEKGSIAIDGISLTVAYVDDRVFKVSVIPHTGEETTLLDLRTGDKVNLECDILAKYVEKLLAFRSVDDDKPEKGSLTMEYLRDMGF